MAETMKTWSYGKVQGKLEDFLVCDESAPAPDRSFLSKDQLVVETISTALNPVDYKLPESWVANLRIKFPATPGLDFCGRVVAKNPSNTSVEIGQLVFGGLPGAQQFGGLGQYILTNSNECAPLPDGINPDHAAAVGTAATTAYQSLLPGTPKMGWRIFINGGSGGCGTWAIQFAKVMGAFVVTCCSTANVEMCQQLGADEVIDYKKTDVVDELRSRGQIFDMVVDNVGSEELYSNQASYLKPNGWYSQVGMSDMAFSTVGTTLLRSALPTVLTYGRKFYFVNQKNSREFFENIGRMMADGKVRAVIDEMFEWEDAPAAIAKVREGRTKGKVVVHVGEP
ncbi:zinc-binding oxidoreductase [Aulographum hederae CBS 113979]|uniref:Zinc-binding oxidoreductase n=1 Tax=Aulographum hederae CBS 113979 TaxID=1176131 RepID=A0A6G1GXD1_9PEZI|nr:zinc-binding oxidoreductase [Aulographum hederae CBS 113979]